MVLVIYQNYPAGVLTYELSKLHDQRLFYIKKKNLREFCYVTSVALSLLDCHIHTTVKRILLAIFIL